MYQPLPRNNRVYEHKGQWRLLWNGDWTPMPADEALRFMAQEPTILQLNTKELTGHALDWAVADAVGYTPRIQVEDREGTMLPGGVVKMGYEDFVIIATFTPRRKYGPFRPSKAHLDSGLLMDQHRISTEIAGDGWAALYNDTFCPATYANAVQGITRGEAAMRCLVMKLLGPKVNVPAELVDPVIRRRLLAA